MDLVFLADIVVQCHSAYFEFDYERGKHVLIDKLGDIRSIYFKELSPFARSLLWDVLAAFPFTQIGCAVHHNDKNAPALTGDARDIWQARPHQFVMFLQMLRSCKILRLWKLSESAEYVSMYSTAWSSIFSLLYLVFILFFSAHFLGCIWFYVGIGSNSIENGWISSEGGILPREEHNWFYEWICCMYFAVATMVC